MRKFAVFDIDGTLIRWQLYHAVVDALGKRKLIPPQSYDQLLTARMGWKQRKHIDSFTKYEEILIKIYEEALPLVNTSLFDQVAQEVANRYKTQVYSYARDLIVKLKRRNYMLLAISGSHIELVQYVARQYGFDDWVGTVYTRDGQHFTGRKVLASKNKHLILNRLIKKHSLSLAGSIGVGDSMSDANFLEAVQTPIAFNPDRKLYQVAMQRGWKIVIERKNVIYTLENKDGHYILA